MKKSFSEKELRDVSREIINIIKGKSVYAGTKPFYHAEHRTDCLVTGLGLDYHRRDIGMFKIIKDFSKKGLYILQALHYLNNEVVFEIPFTSKTKAKELYIMISEKYDKYQEQFNEYELQMTDNNNIKIITDWKLETLKDLYIGMWFKNNKWYSLLVIGEDKIYPKCIDVILV